MTLCRWTLIFRFFRVVDLNFQMRTEKIIFRGFTKSRFYLGLEPLYNYSNSIRVSRSLFRNQLYLFLIYNVPFLELKVLYFALEVFQGLSKWFSFFGPNLVRRILNFEARSSGQRTVLNNLTINLLGYRFTLLFKSSFIIRHRSAQSSGFAK